MVSLLLSVTLRVFKIRKQGRKIIKVASKSEKLRCDLLKNIGVLGNYKQWKIV